jgi:hypothetical protein
MEAELPKPAYYEQAYKPTWFTGFLYLKLHLLDYLPASRMEDG